MRRSILFVLSLGLVMATLAGCGNKGPLVMPTKPTPALPAIAPTPTPAAAIPAPATSSSTTTAVPAPASSAAQPANQH